MKKKCIIITLVSFIILFLLTFLLPEQISVNGGIGKKIEIRTFRQKRACFVQIPHCIYP